jgi:hypothetical protein
MSLPPLTPEGGEDRPKLVEHTSSAVQRKTLI